MKNKLLVSALVSALLASGTALALDSGKDGRKNCDHRGPGSELRRDHHGFGPGKMDRKEMLQRKFSADEVRTLVSARLLMRGNDNLQVGEIKATDNGYDVQIVTKDNSLVEELQLAPNAMPLKMYEKIQERLQQRSDKQA
jgi:hypothetical protein